MLRQLTVFNLIVILFCMQPGSAHAQLIPMGLWNRVPMTGYASTVMADGPRAFFHLNETSSSAAFTDATGNVTTGANPYNNVTLQQSGVVIDTGEHSAYFNGSTSSLYLGNSANLTGYSSFSIEAWIKTNSPAPNQWRQIYRWRGYGIMLGINTSGAAFVAYYDSGAAGHILATTSASDSRSICRPCVAWVSAV